MGTLTRIGIATLVVLLTIPSLTFSLQRPGRGERPGSIQRRDRGERPRGRTPAPVFEGDIAEARAFLERADARVPFSNEIQSATFTARLFDHEAIPSASGDIGRVLAAFRTTRDQLTTTYEVRWGQGAPFDEVVAIKGANFDPDTMLGDDNVDRMQRYYGSVLPFAPLAQLIVPPRVSQWLREPPPRVRQTREERMISRLRQLAESGRLTDEMRSRIPPEILEQVDSPAASDEDQGWVSTLGESFTDYYRGSSVAVDHRLFNLQNSDFFNAEVTLPGDGGGRDAFRLWGTHSDDPARHPAIFDAYVYEQEESVNRPRLLQRAPYHVKWHYADTRGNIRPPGFEIFYSPMYLAQVPPINHALEMDSAFGPADPGPPFRSLTRFVQHEWMDVGPYRVPSMVRIDEYQTREDGSVELFDDPTEILVSEWNIVTRNGERFGQEPEEVAEPAPSLTGDVDEARRLLTGADARIVGPAGDVPRGSFIATYHPHMDDPAERTGNYTFRVAGGFDRQAPFATFPIAARYTYPMGGTETSDVVYDRSTGENYIAQTMGRGAELRMMEFVAMAVPPTFESLIPANPSCPW